MGSSITPVTEMRLFNNVKPVTDSQSEERRRQTTLFEQLRNQYGKVEITASKGQAQHVNK